MERQYRVVDSHCHASPYWYEPLDALLQQMDANGVERATLVQHFGQYDNSYLLAAAANYPDRLAAVVLIDPLASDAPEQLTRLADAGAAGLRLRPTTRSPGADPLAIWRQAAALGIPVTTGSADATELASAEFDALVDQLPDLILIIEHLGWANQPVQDSPDHGLRRQVYRLSRHPNTYMKFHGLGEFCERALPLVGPFPFLDADMAELDLAVLAFGPSRMMWGSDFPPVSGREGYANALRWPMARLEETRSAAEIADMFGAVASRLYWPASNG